MASTADILRRLSALDLTAVAFKEVMSIIADSQSDDDERRRRDRDRKAASRLKSKESPQTFHGNSSDRPQTVQGTDRDDLSPKEIPPTPPKEITPFPTSLRSVSVSTGEHSFARFWQAWPHKVGKPAAERSFAKVAHEIEAILSGIASYIRDKPPDRPWLNPATFLNQRRWEDEPAKSPIRPIFASQNPEKSVHAAAKKLCDDVASGIISFGRPPPAIADLLALDRERERENHARMLPERRG